MNNFNFYSPTFFAFGKGREHETGKLVKRFGGSKVLIHYGSGSVVKSGLLDRVRASLKILILFWPSEVVVQLIQQKQLHWERYTMEIFGTSSKGNVLKKPYLLPQYLPSQQLEAKDLPLRLSRMRTE